ncbi:MAG: DUF4126 domain-containing protein [Euryarchaeota archaeon]|jgi:hypothetical protein|nr:DUF4126 domain-containing protein [Euryarchaeota archaeon]MBT3757603.1 DUF4126 domain-containing protein [Euryarchaeota archaeon]MBT4050883.1 DUF4126 domain-containing protein [Euryarchaeota archaeon]MBT4347143.1 DUF4126 domain-containing protein [Euryarchaeota archaeon]MBT4649614.1 DUF4126 domain-containing protein [Euryarchaeota archaeon]
MDEAGVILAALMGISLAAASGFRVFLPPFLLSLAIRADFVEVDLVGTSFEFFETTPAIIILGVASIAEFAAFYVPWVDSLLDTIASPAAIIAGISMTAIVMEGSDPAVQWAIAIIAGGGASATIQGATVTTRGLSSTFTLGYANSLVATSENVASVALTIVALLAPLVAGIFAVVIIVIMTKRTISKRQSSDS